MRHTAETCLQSADHDGNAGKCLLCQLGVNHKRMRRTFPGGAVFAEHILSAFASADSVEVDHGVHISAGNTNTDTGTSHDFKGFRIAPVRLGDDAYFVAAVCEQPSDDCGAERGVIHIAVAGDDEDVKFVVTAGRHLLPGHW